MRASILVPGVSSKGQRVARLLPEASPEREQTVAAVVVVVAETLERAGTSRCYGEVRLGLGSKLAWSREQGVASTDQNWRKWLARVREFRDEFKVAWGRRGDGVWRER